MSQFLGNRESLAYFANDTNYVVVDTKFNSIVETGYVDETFDVYPQKRVHIDIDPNAKSVYSMP
jgi:hypothetical protein